MLELGYAFLSSLSLPEVAEPHLERLVAEVHESSSVSVLDGDDIVYVARVPTARIMRVSINVGTRFPAYATSMGRVLLAGMDAGRSSTRFLARAELRRLSPRTITSRAASCAPSSTACARQGWAMVDQELEEGLRSVAAPIRDRGGRVVAAVNLSAHASRTSTDAVKRDAAAAAARHRRADRGRPARRLRELAAAVGGVSAPARRVRPRAAAAPRASARARRSSRRSCCSRSTCAPCWRGCRRWWPTSAPTSASRPPRPGVLTTLPVLCMGAFAPLAPRLAARVPMERALVALRAADRGRAPGCAALGTTASLFAAGLAIGVAIALAQALLPVLIRTRFARRRPGC